jgi:hypothetical protein
MSRCFHILWAALLLCSTTALAEDVFYDVPVHDLKITQGAIPAYSAQTDWRNQRWPAMQPRVVLDGEAEGYFARRGGQITPWMSNQIPDQNVAIRVAGAKEPSGRLYLPNADWTGMVVLPFTVPAGSAKPEAKSAFYQAKAAHYDELLGRGIPGAAWFRHEIRQAQVEMGMVAPTPGRGPTRFGPGARGNLESTYELFSGGRAISENLQLDRALAPGQSQEGMVKVDTIPGITIQEIDWKPLIQDAKPDLDPLASLVPADQHVVFFPNFTAAVRVADEAGLNLPLMRLAQPRGEDARTEDRYQRQLCLSLTGLGRLLGPRVAKSVALTGSDNCFPLGTDVAVLFEAPQPAVLEGLLIAQVNLAAAKNKDAKPVEGQVEGLNYHGMLSPDRSISSYVARVKNAVVVTNSTYQLERLAAVAKGNSTAIASLPEFTFFRNRYRRDDPDETALVFISDPTIRRWCGPQWRIASYRRIRDAAVMEELQASQMDRLVKKTVKPGPIYTDLAIAAAGELALTNAGVVSPKLGSLEFMTPIAEMPLAEVTAAEAAAYNRWRDGYQRNWTWAFDPIAMRVVMRDDRLAADLTVMPLIVGTEYREFVDISRGARIAPDAGDPHAALLHFILALNPESPRFQAASNFVSMTAKGVTLGWIGSSVAVYADDDPFWAELAKQEDKDLAPFMGKNFGRMPLGVQFEVANGLKLAAFLTGLRAFVEQTTPGMTNWEALTYHDQAYVKISPTAKAKGAGGVDLEQAAVYYAASGDALVVTLREDLLKRALDRQIARQKAKEEKGKTDTNAPAAEKDKALAAAQSWPGSNVGLYVDRKVLDVLAAVGHQQYEQAMQLRSWGNLPILNEWKHRYPNEDPAKVHWRVWHTELVCPGGGRYVWNEKWQTMESTVYGHPGQPKTGPAAPPALAGFANGAFGLTFEDQGLRARVELRRAAAEKTAKPGQQKR